MGEVEEDDALEGLAGERRRACGYLDALLIEDRAGGALRELHGEEDLAAVAPGVGGAATGQGVGRGAGERGSDDGGFAVGEVAVVEIDEDVAVLGRSLAGGEGVAMQAGALGGGELGADAVVLEQDGVEAGLGVLVGVIEAGAVAGVGVAARTGDELGLAGAGHDEEVEQIAAAGAAEVGVAEAHDGGVGEMVTGAPVPLIVEGVGAELNGTVGDGGAGEGVAVAAGTDADIDERCGIGGGLARLGAGEDLAECAAVGGANSIGGRGAAEEGSSGNHEYSIA